MHLNHLLRAGAILVTMLVLAGLLVAQDHPLPLAAYGADGGVFTADLNNGRNALLTETPLQPNAVVWSPDGQRLAYVMQTPDNAYDVFVYDTISGETSVVATSPSEDIQPAWSPNGSQIAYSSRATGNYDVWVVNAHCDANCAARNLTANPADDRSPTWSADGTTLAFVSSRDADSPQVHAIYTMLAEGGPATRITFEDDQDASAVAWSPDGSRLAYRNGGVNDIGTVEVIDVDGSDRRVLARGDMSYTLAWLPDSAHIVYGCWRQRTYQQCVMLADCGDSIAECSTTRTIYEVGQRTLFSFQPPASP